MRFPAEVVRLHATMVGEVAEQMAVARSAVREVSMDRQAYGEICQFLPGLLDPLFTGAVDVLNGVSSPGFDGELVSWFPEVR
ncbi:hypothetical protein [Actinoplanes cyaneus]|nr:hypothetical protein [Actinoplanes cyaneus]